jgi:hypothetical protein
MWNILFYSIYQKNLNQLSIATILSYLEGKKRLKNIDIYTHLMHVQKKYQFSGLYTLLWMKCRGFK